MSKCLYCYQELEEGQVDYHPACARKFSGSDVVPVLPYTRDNMSELARQVIRTSSSVTGVQAKMSLDVNRGDKHEPAKFTIVGLWGKYIFKPQSGRYPCLPELEDLMVEMAEAAQIQTILSFLETFSQSLHVIRKTFVPLPHKYQNYEESFIIDACMHCMGSCLFSINGNIEL